MKIEFKHRFVVDDHGNRTAVIIDIHHFQKLLELLGDIEDSRYIKKHFKDERVPFEQFLAGLEKENLV